MKVNLEELIVRDENGNLDDDCSARRFKSYLNKYKINEKEISALTINAINSVYDENSETRFNMQALIHFVLVKLGISFLDSKLMNKKSEEIKNYIKNNSGTKDSGSIFNEGWKSGGRGIFRWKDHPDWNDVKYH